MANFARIASADPPKERSGTGGWMRGGVPVDDFEGDGDGVGADHAVAFRLGEAAGADVFDFAVRRDFEAGGVEAGTGADGALEERGGVAGGFDSAGGADLARLEDDRPPGDGGEEFFGEWNHGEGVL